MLASVKALLVGEDLSSDPVSKTLGFGLRLFSGGALSVDVHALSQYLTLAFIGFISISSLRWAGARRRLRGGVRVGGCWAAGTRALGPAAPAAAAPLGLAQPASRPPPGAHRAPPCRGFLKQMQRFFSVLSSAGSATSMVLVTAELLGFYAVSTMLLLR